MAGTAARSEVLIRELEQADCLVIATPMHNDTVPAALKLWIDQSLACDTHSMSVRTGKSGCCATAQSSLQWPRAADSPAKVHGNWTS
ncbi:NAD(P)H-dependent oxidoreductase [Variovorax saccharolyticus]|uniref:NAD(P)H-dependent oxidoreductase n=1 Tax=Variovorax saccharolyticus TaxID=3053516 RepID=UPI00257760F7|nr:MULTISPECIES: NAD(P)H-dependent oxidoreductase [unclassified Variovorax]MDM0022482.1 NAD(P)H-dependent oxidoreductase [Variovorax sp. J22R187]MDM0028246.1 NAD(P)H-dependent oxidoreductase [Variovorax sp. J31P216]